MLINKKANQLIIMKKNKIKLRFIPFLLLFISSVVVSTLNLNSVAKAANSATLKQQVENFTTLYTMSGENGTATYDSTCSFSSTLSYASIINNTLYAPLPGLRASEPTFPSGQSFTSSSQTWTCDQFWQNTLPSIWMPAILPPGDNNEINFFRAIGYDCNDKSATCTTAKSNVDIFNNLVSLLRQKNPALFDNIASTGYNDFKPKDAITYYAYSQAFFASDGCEMQLEKSPSEAIKGIANSEMGGNTDLTVTPWYYKAYAVGSDGTVGENIYSSTHDYNTIVSVIFGVPTDNGGKANCGELAHHMDKNANLANAAAPILRQDGDTGPQAGTADQATTSPYDGCFIHIWLVGWIMCALLSLADQMLGWFQQVISSILFVNQSNFSTDCPASGCLYKAWSSVKDLSSVLILLIGLFMILSQVFGFEFMSAYTVKKILPRLIISAILIQFSWLIFTNFLILVNALGTGVQELLVTPFSQTATFTNLSINQILTHGSQTGGLGASGSFSLLFATIAGSAALAAGGAVGLTILAIGVLISIITIIFTLIVRIALLLLLLVVSPIALIAWVLPGTQSIWKNWWSNFSKLAFMFPIIMLLFSAGIIGATVMSNEVLPGGGTFSAIAAIVAYFGPLFLIPATFKYAGTAMAAASGGVSKLGGMVKEKNPVSKSLGAASEKRQAEKKRKQQIGLSSSSKFKRMRSGFSTGAYGTSKAGRNIMKANAEAEGIKEEGLNIATSIKGLGYDEQKATVMGIAKDPSKNKYERLAATHWLAEKGASAELHEVQASMKEEARMNGDVDMNGEGKSRLWNQASDNDFATIKSGAADIVGKFGETSAATFATQKQDTFNRLQDHVATLADTATDASKTAAQRQAAKAEGDKIVKTLYELKNSEAYVNVAPEIKNQIDDMTTGNFKHTDKTKIDKHGRNIS